MKWIGQHIVDFIARFRSDVYLESIADGTVASDKFLGLDSNNKIVKEAVSSGTTYTAGTGLDLSGTEFSVDVSDFMTDGADNRILTATGADAMLAETYATFVNTGNVSTLSIMSNQDTADLFKIATTTSGATTLTTIDSGLSSADFKIEADGDITLEAAGNDVTVDADTLIMSSSTLLAPYIILKSTGNNQYAGYLNFQKFRDDDSPTDDNDLGTIAFSGDDAAGATEGYGSIVCSIAETDHGDEAGKIEIKVANDGTERNGITMSGDKGTAAEVDVILANGAASVTTIAGNLSVTTGLILDSVNVTTVQTSAESFADNDTSLMTSAAIDDRIAAAGGGKGFLQWYYYSANLSTTNGFYIEKWNDEFGVSSSINSQIADYNDTASSHWQLIRGSRIVPYDATVTKFLVNVENSGTNEDIDVALWKATPSVTSRSSSGTSTTIDHLCTLTYDFTSYSGSGTWTKSTTSFNATSLTQGEYLFVTLKRTSGTDGSNYHVHSTVTFDY